MYEKRVELLLLVVYCPTRLCNQVVGLSWCLPTLKINQHTRLGNVCCKFNAVSVVRSIVLDISQ